MTNPNLNTGQVHEHEQGSGRDQEAPIPEDWLAPSAHREEPGPCPICGAKVCQHTHPHGITPPTPTPSQRAKAERAARQLYTLGWSSFQHAADIISRTFAEREAPTPGVDAREFRLFHLSDDVIITASEGTERIVADRVASETAALREQLENTKRDLYLVRGESDAYVARCKQLRERAEATEAKLARIQAVVDELTDKAGDDLKPKRFDRIRAILSSDGEKEGL